jgi:23S rRNA pseudouridine2605 synthase
MTQSTLRLNKAIAQAGLASRREAEGLIRAGRVRLNGAVVRTPGATLTPGLDRLEVDGRTVAPERGQACEVWALYKPKGCVSTLRDPEGRPTIKAYFPQAAGRLFSIGRLDYDAEGLILLTNDGALAQRVAHPSYSVEKTYLVKVKGLVQADALRSLERGPQLEGRRRRSVKARVLHTVNDKTWLEVILREGIHHHIKKMFAAVGHRVLKIKRYQIGNVTLADMQPGQCRKLGKVEIRKLLDSGSEPGAPAGVRPRRAGPGSRTRAPAGQGLAGPRSVLTG